MNVSKLCLGFLLLFFSLTANAQIDSLPEDALGNRTLPPTSVGAGLGSYAFVPFHNWSLIQYLYGEAGSSIDDQLNQIGIDITADAGVLTFSINFIVLGRPLVVTGQVEKMAGETMEEAFEREYAAGRLEDPAPAMPDVGSLPGGGHGSGEDIGGDEFLTGAALAAWVDGNSGSSGISTHGSTCYLMTARSGGVVIAQWIQCA